MISTLNKKTCMRWHNFLYEMHPQNKRTAFFELRTSKNKTETERTNSITKSMHIDK